MFGLGTTVTASSKGTALPPSPSGGFNPRRITQEESAAFAAFKATYPVWGSSTLLGRTPDGRFLEVVQAGFGLVRVNEYGRKVSEEGVLLDSSGNPIVSKRRTNVKLTTRTVLDASGNPSQVTTLSTPNEIYSTILSGAQASTTTTTSMSTSSSGTQTPTSSTGLTTSGGIGGGLRFSFDSGNESLFLGAWFQDFNWNECHLAVGITINVLNK